MTRRPSQAQKTLRCLAPPIRDTVAYYPLEALSRALGNSGVECLSNPQNTAATFGARVISKLRLVRNLKQSDDGPVLVPFMGYSESRTIPFSYWTEIIPYCFDCWPVNYQRWRSLLVRHRVRLAFFSARQSAEYFGNELKGVRSIWVPEATDPSDYSASQKLIDRDIDVLELGRKNDCFHAAIRDYLCRSGRCHLFERIRGKIIFPTRDELVAGLARSKISVCFPCSQTHPERSGAVETVTHRYFESMASKCIIVGHCPQELKDLFGYNPVVDADQGHEIEQIDFILKKVSDFQGLVDANYSRLLEVGTWTSRVRIMFQIVREVMDLRMPDMVDHEAIHAA